MKNKKLIKSIKLDVKKQIESDIKNSIVKELKNSSNKQIKKLRKQILAEVKEEMFGVSIGDSQNINETSNKKIKDILETKILAGIPVSKEDREKFGIERGTLSDIKRDEDFNISTTYESTLDNLKKGVIDKKSIEKNRSLSDKISDLKSGANKEDVHRILLNKKEESTPPLEKKYTQGFNVIPGSQIILNKNLDKIPFESIPNIVLSPNKKEELTFFLGKLKDGVSKLREDEKNIDYRKKRSGLYSFSFERRANFDLKFEIDLNMNTYEARVQLFDFKIDGLKFDKKSVELLDIVAVLDMSGMNLNKYINEINGINEIDIDKVKTPTAITVKINSNPRPSSKRLGIAKFIEDEKIISLLKNNEVLNLGQILAIEDLTSLKGVGEKTAKKIKKYLKSNTHGVL